MILTDTHTHAIVNADTHTLGVCLSLLRNHEAVAQEIKQFLQLLSTADTDSHESDQTEDPSIPSDAPNSDKKND